MSDFFSRLLISVRESMKDRKDPGLFLLTVLAAMIFFALVPLHADVLETRLASANTPHESEKLPTAGKARIIKPGSGGSTYASLLGNKVPSYPKDLAEWIIQKLNQDNKKTNNELRAKIIQAISLAEDSPHPEDVVVNAFLAKKPEEGGLPLPEASRCTECIQSLGYRAGLMLNKSQSLEVSRMLLEPVMSTFSSTPAPAQESEKDREARLNMTDYRKAKPKSNPSQTAAGIRF